MSRIHTLIISFLAVVTLSGCATSALHTRSAEELIELRDSRLIRAHVDWVVPDYFFREVIDRFTDEEMIAVSGFSKNDIFERFHGIAVGRWYHKIGVIERASGFIPIGMNIETGDIIDIYGGDGDDDAIREKKMIKTYGVRFIGSAMFHSENEGVAGYSPPVVLAIVCRGTDPNCDEDGTPGTQIGFGRKMPNAADYRGVEAESQQVMYKGDTNLAEFFSLDVCLDCKDVTKNE